MTCIFVINLVINAVSKFSRRIDVITKHYCVVDAGGRNFTSFLCLK